MSSYLGFCGRVAAGFSPIISDGMAFAFNHKKWPVMVGLSHGISLGVLAHQAITLSAHPVLLASKTAIILGTTIGGTVTSYFSSNENKKRIIDINFCANTALGAAAIYFGHYTYGISALAATAVYLFDN